VTPHPAQRASCRHPPIQHAGRRSVRAAPLAPGDRLGLAVTHLLIEHAARGSKARARVAPAARLDVELTGITTSDCGATRIVTSTVRFCLAPISSPPSRMSTGVPPEFLMRSSGTWPSAETSVAWIVPSEGGRTRNLDGMNLRLGGFSALVELKVARTSGALGEFASIPGLGLLRPCNLAFSDDLDSHRTT
jgi:hypothetical protein